MNKNLRGLLFVLAGWGLMAVIVGSAVLLGDWFLPVIAATGVSATAFLMGRAE